jgi:AcrR family transcriptional regulator
MARPRTFDESQVLDAAMHAFRREGYAHLSVAGLEAATGLRTSSLYNAFGDKAGLFRRAVEHYVASLVVPRLTRYAGDDATLDDLEQLFLTLFEPPYTDGYGCLLVNSAVELGSARSAEADGVRAGLGLVHRHLEEVVRRELGAAGAPTTAARLALLYQGVLSLSRAGLLAEGHRVAVVHQFQALRGEKSHR